MLYFDLEQIRGHFSISTTPLFGKQSGLGFALSALQFAFLATCKPFSRNLETGLNRSQAVLADVIFSQFEVF